MDVRYGWRAPFENRDLNALHAEGFSHAVLDIGLAHTGRAPQPRLGLRLR